ncbi:MAG TPA: hypothetical protein VK054_13750 [Beutenbergiaceae bacterium]|nr:hypothetical protein [Beutenbergiaceae bacterium]
MTTATHTLTDVRQAGTVVEYQGSLHTHHGHYITQGPCRCARQCGRLRLLKPGGGSTMKHVRPSSLRLADQDTPIELPQRGDYTVRAYDGFSTWATAHHKTLTEALKSANKLADDQHRCWIHLRHADGSTRDVGMVNGLPR